MLYCKHPNKLAQLRQNAHLSQKQLAQKFAQTDYAKPAKTNLITKINFSFCRLF